MNKVPRCAVVIDIPVRWRGDTLDKIVDIELILISINGE